MDKLLKALFQIQEFKFKVDDDFVDRLSRKYTPAICVMFTVLVSVRQYVGEPMRCWSPAQFTESHMQYTDTVCWVMDTYFVPFEHEMPHAEEPKLMISYYKWVPILLLSQGAMFFLPSVIWRFLHHRAGISIASVLEAAVGCQRAIYSDTRDKTVRYMVHQLDSYLSGKRKRTAGCWSRFKAQLATHCCIFYSRIYGNYLSCSYIVVKALYLLNAVGHLFLLDVFLGPNNDYTLYGIQVLDNILRGNDYGQSERFPRVTLCDFRIRQQTNVHRYTVQCVLPINLFNEKIFIFMWFWLLFISLATMGSLVHWLSKLLYLPIQVPYIKRQLKAMEVGKREAKIARRFVECYLKRDGILVVRLVSKNAGEIVAAELLHGLFSNYNPDKRILTDRQDLATRPLIGRDIV